MISKMEFSTDWAYSIFIVLSLSSIIECLEIIQKDHSSEITSENKYVEKYQLPGGNNRELIKSLLWFHRKIICGWVLLSAYAFNFGGNCFPGKCTTLWLTWVPSYPQNDIHSLLSFITSRSLNVSLNSVRMKNLHELLFSFQPSQHEAFRSLQIMIWWDMSCTMHKFQWWAFSR